MLLSRLSRYCVIVLVFALFPSLSAFAQSNIPDCDAPAAPNVNWSGCNKQGVNLEGVDQEGVDLSGAILINTNFESANLANAVLSGANAQYANFTGANLFNIDADDANFSFANLEEAYVEDADFLGANIDSLIISTEDGRETDIRNVEFYDTQIPQYINASAELVFGLPVGISNADGQYTTGTPNLVQNPGVANIAPLIESERRLSRGSNTVTRSSTARDGFGAWNAVDASLLNGRYFESEAEASPWWEIDLGVHYQLAQIRLHMAEGYEEVDDLVIVVSDWPLSEDPLVPVGGDFVSRIRGLDPIAAIKAENIDRTARYIRIQRQPGYDKVLALSEVEIFARIVSPQDDLFGLARYETTATTASPDDGKQKHYLVGDPINGEECFENDAYFKPELLESRVACLDVGNSSKDLANCDLSTKIMKKQDFRYFDLSGADLSGADLRGAKFYKANLSNANLQGANLTGAYLNQALLSGADMRGAIFSVHDEELAIEEGDDYLGATRMSGANVSCAVIDNSTWEEYNLLGAIGAGDVDNDGWPSLETITENNATGFARQSSTDFSRTARFAFDEETYGAEKTYSETTREASPWWMLDLGDHYNIQSIDIDFGVGFSTDMDGAHLMVSDWPFPKDPYDLEASDLATVITLYDEELEFPTVENRVNTDQTGRYLRVQLPEVNGQEKVLTLADVRVNGPPRVVAPSTTQPTTPEQKALFPETEKVRASYDDVQRKMLSSKEHVYELKQGLRQVKYPLDVINKVAKLADKINDKVQELDEKLTTLKVVKQIRPTINKLQKPIKKIQRKSDKANKYIQKINDRLAPPRYTLMALSISADQANRAINHSRNAVQIQQNFIETVHTCSINTHDMRGRLPLEAFSTVFNHTFVPVVDGIDTLNQTYIDIEDTLNDLKNAVDIDVEIIRILFELEAVLLEIEVFIDAVDLPIDFLYTFMEVKFNFGLFSFSVADIIDGFVNLPGVSDALAIIDAAIEQALAPIADLLLKDLIDLPTIPYVDILPDLNLDLPLTIDFTAPDLPSISLLDLGQIPVPNIDGLDLSIPVPGFPSVLDLIGLCPQRQYPQIYPLSDEDADGDGLLNGDEIYNIETGLGHDTDPFNPDSDLDGMNDGFEVKYNLLPNDASTQGPLHAEGDADSDGLTNLEEFLANTNPRLKDSDEDTLEDGWEVRHGFDPNSPDIENVDADGDGLFIIRREGFGDTSSESELLTSPYDTDTDRDGVSDMEEFLNGWNPLSVDTDGDNIPDGQESQAELDPLDATDANRDADQDGLSNVAEVSLGTLINVQDSDRDGLNDDVDSAPLEACIPNRAADFCDDTDSDADGIPDWWEYLHQLDADLASDALMDTDDDGYTHLEEYQGNSDPNNQGSSPVIVAPPSANAGDDQRVDEGVSVQLDGSASTVDPSRTAFYAWRQVSGPAVVIESTSSAKTTFVAPEVADNEVVDLVFELSISDGQGQVATARATISVADTSGQGGSAGSGANPTNEKTGSSGGGAMAFNLLLILFCYVLMHRLPWVRVGNWRYS